MAVVATLRCASSRAPASASYSPIFGAREFENPAIFACSAVIRALTARSRSSIIGNCGLAGALAAICALSVESSASDNIRPPSNFELASATFFGSINRS
ncbi:hypothetical protein D3C86_1900480 [compost metagenome]